ncbi:MAG: TolC family protein [Deltaproteobacteria bacterium]|nr:TolC family protein [Deltaproteobacteria bacterium]
MRTEKRSLGVIALIIMLVLGTTARAAETVKPLSLSDSIDMALKRSVLIHAAQEGVRGAEAQRKEAFTGFLPKFSSSYSFTRLNEEPVFKFPGVPPLVPATTIKTGTKENFNWNIEARQPLFAGGGILANYQASRLGVDIAKFEESAAFQDLVQEVKIAYFNNLKANRILTVARQSLELLKAHKDTAQAFYDVGVIPKNDLLYAEVEVANGRQFLVRAENGVEMAKSKFNTVLRREINAPVEIEDVLNEPPFEKPLEACITAALENRPEIRSYALRLEQAKSLVAMARSEYYPNVAVVGNYARYGDTPGVAGSPYRDQENWYVMAVANWIFWEWGKTKNRVDAGLSRENQAADILTNIRDQITLEVKNAFLLLHEAEKQIQVSKKAIEQAEENFRINVERYREQVGTSTDVIDAQTLLTKIRSDHDNALGDYSISRARLERAMGIAVRGETK